MRNQSSQWLIPLVLAAGAALALWYYWVQISEPVAEAPVERLITRVLGSNMNMEAEHE